MTQLIHETAGLPPFNHSQDSAGVRTSKQQVESELENYTTERSGGMAVIEERYRYAIEEIITINELLAWVRGMDEPSIDSVFRDIDIHYRLEMNLSIDDE